MNTEDRRSAPRFEVLIKGTITSSTGQISSVEISNISASGLQFNIAQAEIPHLIPNHSQTNTMTPVQIDLSCDLPHSQITNAKTLVRIQCGIVYVKKISIDQCNVGCRFEQFYRQSEQQLENYIKNCSDNQFPRIEVLAAPTQVD